MIPKIIAKMLPKAVDSLCAHVYANTVLHALIFILFAHQELPFP